MNVITLNRNNLVVGVKQVGIGYKLQVNEIEVVDFDHRLMNKRYENGIFITSDNETITEPTIEEQILTETKYQTVLLEMNTGL